MKEVSIVVPCYNEAKGLHFFYHALNKILKPLPYRFHILLVAAPQEKETAAEPAAEQPDETPKAAAEPPAPAEKRKR